MNRLAWGLNPAVKSVALDDQVAGGVRVSLASVATVEAYTSGVGVVPVFSAACETDRVLKMRWPSGPKECSRRALRHSGGTRKHQMLAGTPRTCAIVTMAARGNLVSGRQGPGNEPLCGPVF